MYCTTTVRRIGKGNSSTQNACWISPLGLLVPLFWHAHAASQQHGEAWSPLTIGSVCLFPCPPCSLAAAWNCHPLIKHGNGKSTIFVDGFPKNPSVCMCGFHGFSIATFDYRRVYLINFLCSLVKSLFNALNHLSSNQETNRTAVSTMLVRRLNPQAPMLLVVLHLCGGCQKNDWLVVFTILKNII